jgi:hypothetical protein
MWDVRLKQLLEFREVHGHLDVPRGWPENPSLAHWVVNQRRDLRHGRLSPSRLQQLKDHDIRWPGAEELAQSRGLQWDRMFEALASYHREHGHGNVPSGWEPDPELGRWVARQRHQFRCGTLREDRRVRLEQLPVDWPAETGRSRSRDLRWERMIESLVAFRTLHRHSNVPKGWPENPELARWLARQRHLYRTRGLRPDRRLRLEELDALRRPAPLMQPTPLRVPSTGARERTWTLMLEALAAFKSVQGHCHVPRRWTWNPTLARWVSEQRRLRQEGSLDPVRLQRLEAIGFEWEGVRSLDSDRATSWEGQFRRLLAYRQRHGHCEVPARFAEDPTLGRWIAAQRSLHRSGHLKRDRLHRLNEIGFSWNARSVLRTR